MGGVSRDLLAEIIQEREGNQRPATAPPPVTRELLGQIIQERGGTAIERASPGEPIVDPTLQTDRLVPPLAPDPNKGAIQQIPERSDLQRAQDISTSFVAGAARSIPFGEFGRQRLVAFGRSFLQGIPYEQAVEDVRQDTDRARAAEPGAEIVGGLVGTGALVAAAPAAFGLRTGAGLLERAGAGGAAAAVTSYTNTRFVDQQSHEEALGAAALTGVIGAVLTPWLARIGGNLSAQTQSIATTGQRIVNPTVETLQQQADDFTRQLAMTMQVRVSRNDIKNLAGELSTLARRQSTIGIPTEVTQSIAALRDVAKGKGSIPLFTVNNLRQDLTDALARHGELPTRAREITVQALQRVDDFVMSRIGGNAATARQAQEMLRMATNARRIDLALEAAQTHASGLAAGIRQEFVKLAKDRRFMATLNPTERTAVREMGKFSNFRGLGLILSKADPSRSNLRLMMIMSGVAAGSLVSAPASIATGMAVIGAGKAAAAKTGATMTRRALQTRAILTGQQQIPQSTEVGRRAGATLGQVFSRELGGG